MDRIDELNTRVGKLNMLIDTKMVCTPVFDEMPARKYFLEIERNFSRLIGDGSCNLRGVLLGQNDWCQSPREGLRMSYGKTLKLGF
jgi:hypothetical protein